MNKPKKIVLRRKSCLQGLFGNPHRDSPCEGCGETAQRTLTLSPERDVLPVVRCLRCKAETTFNPAAFAAEHLAELPRGAVPFPSSRTPVSGLLPEPTFLLFDNGYEAPFDSGEPEHSTLGSVRGGLAEAGVEEMCGGWAYGDLDEATWALLVQPTGRRRWRQRVEDRPYPNGVYPFDLLLLRLHNLVWGAWRRAFEVPDGAPLPPEEQSLPPKSLHRKSKAPDAA